MTPAHPILRQTALLLLAVFLLAACSPTYNWREVRGEDAPFTVLLPAKPASHSRELQINGQQLTMHMTAARVEDATFAVGVVQVLEQAEVAATLDAMRGALLNNIDGSLLSERALPPPAGIANASAPLEFLALGKAHNGQAIHMHARLAARERWVYQVVAVANADSLGPEVVETFLTSFVPN